ncbi:helicase-related protein [Hydrogenobacter hydrogenophilus]|uniref:Helicase conserved C-terminal domain-containing protein n=1 Tax=Hydrogenobacter hydrogenophilus TaxID=35835 RepID=A0A285P0Z6_9AQUI|nr:helicase-related protein [Hydrogenobacter hydrogenophilus]SNZ13551.1 Helicase conserved C-terminal domain-containing protein [Hydrogenobacter hydrogenophilus]
MKWEVSFLGLVFECAFKLGFLKDRVEDYDSFKQKQVFAKLRGEIESLEGKHACLPALELLERNIPFEPTENPPKELTALGHENSLHNYLLFLFLTGYYEGYFYQKKLKKLELIKYHIGEESLKAGIYHNTDLLFVADDTLYVVDFKLAGAYSRINKLFTTKEDSIPYKVYGLPVNLSLGELNFERFVRNVLNVEDKLLTLKSASTELKGFLQVLSYAVDYLSENPREDLKEVCLSLLYPLAEPFVARFYLEGNSLEPYREKVRELYDKIREKTWEYEEVDATSKARISRLIKETQEKIEDLIQEVKRREEEVLDIEPDPIEQARKDVKERLEWFLQLDQPVKAICLLHSAGSGKTSQTRDLILNLEGNHIVFYFATRKVLVDREYQTLKATQRRDLELIYEKKTTAETERAKKVKMKGDTAQDISFQSGIIRRTVDKVKSATTKDGRRFIWAFLTQQAIVNTHVGRSTTEHIKDYLLSGRIRENYTFHFILDEFLGHQNGLFAVGELLKLLEEIEQKGGRANLYIFDANGYTPALLEKLLKEYERFEVIPSAIVLTEFKQEMSFEYKGIKLYCFAKHGYPSPKMNLVRRFVFLEKTKLEERRKELICKLAQIVERTFTDKEKSTALMFIQNKDDLAELERELKSKGFETLVATADSRKSQESINKGHQDIILSTSAISRGIDLSREHKPVNHIYAVIYDWGIENNLVELIQSISRARGDKKTEQETKTLHLIYVIPPTTEYILDHIEEYLDEEKVDGQVIELLYRKHSIEQRLELDFVISRIIQQFLKSSDGTVLVPLPNQYKTYYIPNSISEIEGVLNFIDGLYQIEKDKDLDELRETLLKALSVSVVNLKIGSYENYFHPYLLFSRQKLRSSFDAKKRRKAEELVEKLKPILEKHNEDKTKELQEMMGKLLPGQEDQVPVLVPVYALVLVRHFLKPKEKVEFKVKGRIGRGGADVLMGTVEPMTKCYVGDVGGNEYACITLTEDYPYTEVLSGRFVKFPVEFIKGLLEGS